jgi:hypothetical protein
MGIGTMLTSFINVVQSSCPGRDQGDISGLSRSFSTWDHPLEPPSSALSWSRPSCPPGQPFAVALTTILVLALIGVLSAVLIPRQPGQTSHEMTNSRC